MAGGLVIPAALIALPLALWAGFWLFRYEKMWNMFGGTHIALPLALWAGFWLFRYGRN